MRALQVCPVRRYERYVISRIDFTPGGTALVVWLEDDEMPLRYDLATDAVEPHFGADVWSDIGGEYEYGWAVSPDLKLLAVNHDYESESYTAFIESEGRDYMLPYIRGTSGGHAALAFAPDGRTLWAVRDDEGRPEVARLPLDPILAPKRLVEKKNPLNGVVYKTPATLPKWKPLMRLPKGAEVWTAALSANGRLLATGTAGGSVHVCDLKKKTLVASFPWAGRKLKDRWVRRVAFDPTAKWVVSLAAGRLNGHPLGAGKAWHTKPALGAINDFAFHPGGRVICAACADGEARFLDPLTGAVRQSFKWAKKPKPLYSVCFAPDGLTCAVGDESGKVVVWDVDV